MSAENTPPVGSTEDESELEFPDIYGIFEMESSQFPFMAYDALSDSWYEKWASEGDWVNPDYSGNSGVSRSYIWVPQPSNNDFMHAKSDNVAGSSSQDVNEFAYQSNTESETNFNDRQAPESGNNMDELADDSEQAPEYGNNMDELTDDSEKTLINDPEPHITDGYGRILSYAKKLRICYMTCIQIFLMALSIFAIYYTIFKVLEYISVGGTFAALFLELSTLPLSVSYGSCALFFDYTRCINIILFVIACVSIPFLFI
ncbi:hypothetical protein TNIN_149691 [Trichonephila inaurata madagascariensis]|uniref:Uncharacterized protein n=1 Tax=Trichonephila inaurata madagascariensis TaxID=2747483 RepID=A0A8X6YRC0_9ARAC|nr:hypothetical protein TNIN_149691 [Trichonephila inaurata madagascariensis]